MADAGAELADVGAVDVDRDGELGAGVVDGVDVPRRLEHRDRAHPVHAFADWNQAAVPRLSRHLVAHLALLPLMDADHAPGDVVVDRGRLPGQPDQRHDRETAVLLRVQDVLAVVMGVRLALLRSQQVGVSQKRTQSPSHPSRHLSQLTLRGQDVPDRAHQIVEHQILRSRR